MTGDVVLYADTNHLSAAGSAMLAAVVAQSITQRSAASMAPL
jgi:hypothetical protein